MSSRHDGIYDGGFAGSSQLDPADSLSGDIGDDSLDAGYSPPDFEPCSARDSSTIEEIFVGETLEQRLAEEEPEVSVADLRQLEEEPRAGRLVADAAGAKDVGYAGWAASAEEAAMHIRQV